MSISDCVVCGTKGVIDFYFYYLIIVKIIVIIIMFIMGRLGPLLALVGSFLEMVTRKNYSWDG